MFDECGWSIEMNIDIVFGVTEFCVWLTRTYRHNCTVLGSLVIRRWHGVPWQGYRWAEKETTLTLLTPVDSPTALLIPRTFCQAKVTNIFRDPDFQSDTCGKYDVIVTQPDHGANKYWFSAWHVKLVKKTHVILIGQSGSYSAKGIVASVRMSCFWFTPDAQYTMSWYYHSGRGKNQIINIVGDNYWLA